ncbi:hypothetical protein SAMN02982994_1716 [Azospirillum lipoferum]|nr:hypothetical protein SAMN02982994_1716 [Azospirillum lipoferum]
MVEDGTQAGRVLAIKGRYEARDFSGLIEEARALHDRHGDALDPPVREAVAIMLHNASCVAMEQGPRDKVLELAECAVRYDPASLHALGQRMYAHLSRGDYASAWAWESWEPIFRDALPTMWRGGRTDILLIINSNGLGDFIQYSRFLPAVRERVGRLIVQVPLNTTALFGQSPFLQGIEFVEPGAGVACTAICEMMLLPVMMGAGRPQVTATGAYLRAPPHRLTHWQALVDGYGDEGRKLTVGVSWGGGARRARTLPFERLLPLFARRDAHFFGLQNHADKAEIFGRALPDNFTDMGVFDAVNLSCLCRCMDVVIAPDMGVAHLSAALGGETWLALPHFAEWRWGMESTRTDWYPTMRLFRQPEPGDWDGVVEAMAHRLAERARSKTLEGGRALV